MRVFVYMFVRIRGYLGICIMFVRIYVRDDTRKGICRMVVRIFVGKGFCIYARENTRVFRYLYTCWRWYPVICMYYRKGYWYTCLFLYMFVKGICIHVRAKYLCTCS